MSNFWKKKYYQQKKASTQPADVNAKNITGIVENIVYRSEESGYTVCSIKVTGMKDTMTVVGTCPAIWVGETLTADGSWTRHKQHGYQFQAESIKCVPPTSAKGIERYLASGVIDGVGKVNAERIVKRFGKDTLRVIEKESKRLEEIEGIGRITREKIKSSWESQKGSRDIMIFLQGHGIGSAQSARIFKHYGDKAIKNIRENPYKLCRDIWGIGFKTADSIAMSVGIPAESELRARAGLIHVMRTFTEEGHCYCPAPELLLQAESLLIIPVEILADALNYEIRKGTLVKDGENIYLASIHEAEVSIAEKVHMLLNSPAPFKPIDTDKALPWAEEKIGINFAPSQAEALSCAMTSKVSIITGGPGVGKTTIIDALVEVFKTRKLRLQLAAPTGRAAKRMSEATGCDAKTIHRLLKFIPAMGHFEHDAENPIEGDVFILDEVSMIDALLMSSFLEAIPDEALLILVGDIDQLPSVGPGNILSDLIASGCIPSTKLDTIFRQQERSGIVVNAHHVNRGEPIEDFSDPESQQAGLSDFYFIHTKDPDHAVNVITDLVTDRIPNRFGFDPLTELQLLTPMRKNQLGTDNLNAVLQGALNPTGTEIEKYGRKYRVGDRVMQIRNNYDKEVFNGDIGIISRVDQVDKVLVANIDGREIKYEFSELDELIHAFACTIHKSQGSEYPAVLILVTTQHFKLLQRNLLYTAITRGRKLVCLVGSKKAISMAISNNNIKLRRTGLRERIINFEKS